MSDARCLVTAADADAGMALRNLRAPMGENNFSKGLPPFVASFCGQSPCFAASIWDKLADDEPLDRHIGFSISGMEGDLLPGNVTREQNAALLRGAFFLDRDQLHLPPDPKRKDD